MENEINKERSSVTTSDVAHGLNDGEDVAGGGEFLFLLPSLHLIWNAELW
jgi:hypothetical protein